MCASNDCSIQIGNQMVGHLVKFVHTSYFVYHFYSQLWIICTYATQSLNGFMDFSRTFAKTTSCFKCVHKATSSHHQSFLSSKITPTTWEGESLHTSKPFIHPTEKLGPLHVCCWLISNDFEYTNSESLKLIPISYHLKIVSFGCILFWVFYVGWMRNTLIYDNSLPPISEARLVSPLCLHLSPSL